MPDEKLPFWRTKTMAQMTPREWESLCDTDVGCKLLDGQTCRCTDYPRRQAKVKDCIRLTPRNIKRLSWLPPTCGYRLVAEGRDLYWWHPLVSGDADTVHAAGVSVRGRVTANEKDVPDSELEKYIVSWPGKWPKGAKGTGPKKPQRGRGKIGKS
jgi:uncharacterized cysteine cluster protein YcgN (CxxCxxCC family)